LQADPLERDWTNPFVIVLLRMGSITQHQPGSRLGEQILDTPAIGDGAAQGLDLSGRYIETSPPRSLLVREDEGVMLVSFRTGLASGPNARFSDRRHGSLGGGPQFPDLGE